MSLVLNLTLSQLIKYFFRIGKYFLATSGLICSELFGKMFLSACKIDEIWKDVYIIR